MILKIDFVDSFVHILHKKNFFKNLGPPRVRRDIFKNDGIESIGHLSRWLSSTFSEPYEGLTSEKKNFVFLEKIIEKNP